ncbi:hypothetical protein G7Y41_06255 [Schaalia sp. ZJ405]|nr:hypothetical protein G7Y41_06255 [Schaalia sp. ZJ405]
MGKRTRRLIVLLSVGAVLCGCSNSGTAMRSERIIPWTEYEVSGERELNFTVNTGDPQCYGTRTVVKETGRSLQAAIVEGVLPDAPETCTAVGLIKNLTVTTESVAQDLKVHPLPVEEVELNP